MTYKYFILIFLSVSIVFSCTEEVFDPVVRPGDAPTITNPVSGGSFVLSEELASSVLATFEWSEANYGFQAGVSYKVEIDLAGAGFANKVSLGNTTDLSLAVTQEKINGILLAGGIEEAVPVGVEVRVVASVSSEVASLISSPVSFSVTPYIVEVVYPQLQVPGAYQGWDPANNTTVIYSLRSDGNFEGYLYFPDDNVAFKYTDGPSWDVNYGDDGADGTLEAGGGDIFAATAGLYKLNVNLIALTHSWTPTNWGVIGDATPNGWDADQDMTFDESSGTLKITLDLTAGEIKFRANDAWDLDFGDDETNGTLEYGGANIPVAEAGNYTIELILNQPKYGYKLTKN